MKVIIEGKPVTLFKTPDYKSPDSGEVTPGKNKLNLQVETKLSNGAIKYEMLDISIPEDRIKEYEAQIGKMVQVKCDYVSKSQVSFYVK